MPFTKQNLDDLLAVTAADDVTGPELLVPMLEALARTVDAVFVSALETQPALRGTWRTARSSSRRSPTTRRRPRRCSGTPGRSRRSRGPSRDGVLRSVPATHPWTPTDVRQPARGG